MNGPLSDGNENTMDIFVLSTSTTDSPLQARDLEKLGYRATFFSSAQPLFESLRSGKPNLLICDSVTLHEEAYDLCRTLKADYDLWVVPVLIITSASNLADLLHVLDCNADNFISSPFDPAYFSALVEGMLSTPVERPTPDQIKTQFKIQHDDQLFVVTADRRRLLEFLLSSFEIAVNRSGDIIRIRGEKEEFRARLEQKEERIRDQARSIEALNGTLRQKEQAIGALTADVEERDLHIQKSDDEIRHLKSEIDEGKGHIAAAEQQVLQLTHEAGDLAHRYTSETGDLSRKLAQISEHLAATTADLKAAEDSLALETSRKTDAQTLLSETTAKKDLAEKRVHELLLEIEDIQASFAAAKERIQTLEDELASLTRAKSETEQDLNRTIGELKEVVSRQDTDLSRQKGELAECREQISRLETQIASLQNEKESIAEELRTTTEASARSQEELQGNLSSTRAILGEREQAIVSLNAEIEQITGTRDATARDLLARSEELGTLKESFTRAREDWSAEKEELVRRLQERDSSLQALDGEYRTACGEREELQAALERVQADLDSAAAGRSAAASALETATARIRSLEDDLGHASSAGSEARQQVQSLAGELDESRNRCLALEAALAERKNETERVSGELGTALASRSDLEKDLARAQEKIRELESGLVTATTTGAQTGKQVQALTDELEQIKAELGNSLRLRHTIEESLNGERLQKDQMTTELQNITRERDALRADLVKEKQVRSNAEAERERYLTLHTSSEAEGRTQEASLNDTIRVLRSDLDSSRAKQRELEAQISTLSREKQQADERALNLAAEIDQARTALADEWEDHMNAQERLVAVVQEKSEKEQLQQPGELESEKAKKRSLVVKGPDLPANIGKRPQSLSAVPSRDLASPAPRIRNVEDLFEDEEVPDEGEESDVPIVSIIQEPSDGDEVAGDLADDSDSDMDSLPDPDSSEDTDEPDEEPEEVDTDSGDPGASLPSQGYAGGIPPAFAFNRAQWFDLLKWAHHSGTLTQEQRMQIVRMGRLIQKGRRLTQKQEEQVKEMLSLVRAQGYRFI
jgi:chromosome segregation ATPase